MAAFLWTGLPVDFHSHDQPPCASLEDEMVGGILATSKVYSPWGQLLWPKEGALMSPEAAV